MAARKEDRALRDHLLFLLGGGGAHIDFEEAVTSFPAAKRGARPPGAAHSGWELLEHMRIAQWDILEFVRNPKHVSPAWPSGYWPAGPEPPRADSWDRGAAAFRDDLRAIQDLVANPETDLYARLPHGDGQTVLREALLVADHNSYHLGQLALTGKLLTAK